MDQQYDRDPVVRLIAEQLDLLGVDFHELRHQIVQGRQVVQFWSQVVENPYGRYSDGDIARVVRTVRDHFTDNGVEVTWVVSRSIGEIAFTLTA